MKPLILKIIFLFTSLSVLGLSWVWLKKSNFLTNLKTTQNYFNDSPKVLCKNCNVLLIDIDVLRADELPCYGDFRNTAPNLCALAEKSIIFTNNYSSSIWTLPSIFSTITSLYPMFHKVNSPYQDQLAPEITTLAETLAKSNYYGTFVGEDFSKSVSPSSLNGGLRGYAKNSFEPLDQVIADNSKISQPWFIHYYTSYLLAPYLFSSKDFSPIENLPKPKNLPLTQLEFNQKLNIYLKAHYREIFTPLAIEKYRSIILAPVTPGDVSVINLLGQFSKTTEKFKYVFQEQGPMVNTYLESIDIQNPSDLAYIKMLYDTKIKLLDEKIGNIYKLIETAPYKDNTILIVTSDHGEAFFEHGFLGHGSESMFTENYQTPLIIYYPGVVAKKIDHTTSNIDIFPTILDLIGAPTISSLQGESLVPYLLDKPADPTKFVISESFSYLLFQNKRWLYSKNALFKTTLMPVLYDKLNDPAEKINVAEKYPELIKFIDQKFEAYEAIKNQGNEIKPPEPTPIQNSQLKEKTKMIQINGYF